MTLVRSQTPFATVDGDVSSKAVLRASGAYHTVPLSYWHLPITPFHSGLQKAKGTVDGFTELKEKQWSTDAPMRMESQEENSSHFQSETKIYT